MVRIALFLCALAGLWANAAAAQTWTYQTWDNGHLIHAVAGSGQGLSFRCNGPSTGGLDALTAEAHEDTRTPRGQMLIEIGPDRVPLGNAYSRGDVVLWVDETGYRLPMMTLNELDGVWQVQVSTRDALFVALMQGQDVVVAPGIDAAWSYATPGLRRALEQAMSLCEAAWTGQGPAFARTTEQLRRAAHLDIIKGCSGMTYSPGPEAILEGQIDGDGVADIVVKWDDIACQGSFPRPFCGASACSVKVFLSSRAGARPLDLLAQSASLTQLSNGRTGLQIGGRFASCGPNSLGCQRVWYWNGSDLVELP